MQCIDDLPAPRHLKYPFAHKCASFISFSLAFTIRVPRPEIVNKTLIKPDRVTYESLPRYCANPTVDQLLLYLVTILSKYTEAYLLEHNSDQSVKEHLFKIHTTRLVSEQIHEELLVGPVPEPYPHTNTLDHILQEKPRCRYLHIRRAPSTYRYLVAACHA